MMNDPAFKAQMEEMMKDPAFVEQQRMMAEQFADPRKAAAMEQQFEQFMQGAGQNKEQILAGNAKDARRRARAHAHADQASDPEEAYNALKRGGVDVGLSGPQGGLDDALSMLNDPQARAEIQKMMSDPDFADKFQAMSNDPKFAAAMDHAKGVMVSAALAWARGRGVGAGWEPWCGAAPRVTKAGPALHCVAEAGAAAPAGRGRRSCPAPRLSPPPCPPCCPLTLPPRRRRR